MTCVLIRDTGWRTQCEDIEIQREESHVKMEAEIGFMILKVKIQLELPEAGRGKEGPPSEVSEEE